MLKILVPPLEILRIKIETPLYACLYIPQSQDKVS
jgi:hypothetical protein